MFQVDRKYRLPFEPQGEVKISQGWNGPFSHGNNAPNMTDMTYAVDFQVPLGTPVLAARGGRARLVVDDKTEYYDGDDRQRGLSTRTNFVSLEHEGSEGKEYTIYSHLAPGSVPDRIKRGDEVKEGEIIGRTGQSGWAPVPHVHFQALTRDPESGRLKSRPVQFKGYDGPLEDKDIRAKR
jgi:murein DD-endopeptidase MepM/ murein hydrolase activator NlpD